MALTEDQVKEAIEQMKIQCDLKMVGYEPVSARSALRELGYDGEDLHQVLQYIYDHGFKNCLDHHFPSTFYDGNGMKTEYPSADVCYWGPDQLKSRLDSL